MKCDAVVEGEEGSWQVLVKCPSPQGTAELSSAPTKRDDISTVSCDVSAVQSSVSCDMSAVQSSSPSLQSPYVEGDVYSINTHVAQISAAISSRPMQVGHATSGLLLALFFSIWPNFFSPLFLFTFLLPSTSSVVCSSCNCPCLSLRYVDIFLFPHKFLTKMKSASPTCRQATSLSSARCRSPPLDRATWCLPIKRTWDCRAQ